MTGQRKRTFFLLDILANPGKAPVAYFFIFFIIGLVSGVSVNGFSTVIFGDFCDWLAISYGLSKVVWQLIISFAAIPLAGLLVVAFDAPRLISRIWDQGALLLSQEIEKVQTKELTAAFSGLITTASPGKLSKDKDGNPIYDQKPAELAIRRHLQGGILENCWIICTRNSLDETERVIKRLVDEGIATAAMFHYGFQYELSDPHESGKKFSLGIDDQWVDDPNHIRELINHIFIDAKERYQFEDEDIITDFTGGTKSFTAGVILACASPNRRLQYISQIDQQMKEIEIEYKVRPIKSPKTIMPVATSQPF